MICKLERTNREVDLETLVRESHKDGIENTIRRQGEVITNLLEHLYKTGVLDNHSLSVVLGISSFSPQIIATKESWSDEWPVS